MTTSGSSFTPTSLGHEDNLEVRHHQRANAVQAWRITATRLPTPILLHEKKLRFNLSKLDKTYGKFLKLTTQDRKTGYSQSPFASFQQRRENQKEPNEDPPGS
ncbi:hypothetical protein TNCV_3628951 [Trichonephila clavipes]|nr:hypothetical protein TNCV_3628951 [Trichonephila clavipes]